MKRTIILLAMVSLLFSGCASLFDGSYVSITPHKEQNTQTDSGFIHVKNYDELCKALANMAQNGTESGIVYVSRYDQSKVDGDMERAVKRTLEKDPIAAYAVDEIQWELGTNSGQSAVAVTISYVHNRTEIRKIRQAENLKAAESIIAEALQDCETGVVLYLQNYLNTDFVQLVEDYADQYPQYVMETPQVIVNLYPDKGAARVVELKFSYQTSRESLRAMQNQVRPVFTSASLYVSGDAEDREKFSQLYSFLMERYDYQLETSITPAYSLLRHGVGDAKAFAVIYAAMCREAGLECLTVSGTRWGEPWYWNMIEDDGKYYHVDLLRCSQEELFHERTDEEMEGYVWDYSAFPKSEPRVEPTDPTVPTSPTVPTEQTQPTLAEMES
jgi:hypothetical protein